MTLWERRRALMMAQQASNLQRCEWIESDGVAYINSGIFADEVTSFGGTMTWTSSFTGDKFVLGAQESQASWLQVELYSLRYWYNRGCGKAYTQVDTQGSGMPRISLNSPVEWSMNASAFAYSGKSVSPTGSVNAPHLPVYVFTRRNSDGAPSANVQDHLRISGLWFVVDGQTITLTPMYRRSTGEIGLYRSDTGELLTNAAAAGGFTKGADAA